MSNLIKRLQGRNESLLTHVFRGGVGHGKTHAVDVSTSEGYVVLDFDGSMICTVDSSIGMTGDVREWLYAQAGGTVVCTCGAELIEGEVGLCGPCEAETVMSLVRLRDQTA